MKAAAARETTTVEAAAFAVETAGDLTAIGAATVVVASSVIAIAEAAIVAEGIESPAEGAVEGVRAYEGVSIVPWVPIPAGAVASGGIVPGEVGVGFRQVFGAQAAPVVELILVRVLIEVLRLHPGAVVEGKLMALFDRDPLIGSYLSGRLSFKHRSDIVVGVEFVQTGLEELGRDARFDDLDVVLGMDLIDLDGCTALFELELGKGEIGRDHFDSAVVVETQVDARRQKDFCFSVLGREHLTGVERNRSDRLLSDGLSGDERGALNVVDCPWMGWVCAKRRRAQSHQGDDYELFRPGNHFSINLSVI